MLPEELQRRAQLVAGMLQLMDKDSDDMQVNACEELLRFLALSDRDGRVRVKHSLRRLLKELDP